ncbi:MAG TPA: FGGY family carbohydrate kinase [Thiopseudomonas sp.]|nr:FGGY family carbohydrate kinase [Thiopseudomonas sp.]
MSVEHSSSQAQLDYVLSIDNGTQSVRAMLFDTLGNLFAMSRVEIEPYFSTEPDWAEQEADYYWQKVG